MDNIGDVTYKSITETEDDLRDEVRYKHFYKSIVAMEGGLTVARGYAPLYPPEDITVTAGENLIACGGIPALANLEEECGMPLNSLVAMEDDFVWLKERNDLCTTFTQSHAEPQQYHEPNLPLVHSCQSGMNSWVSRRSQRLNSAP
jgi:hypothetical protein